ncbi:hypothetical protein BJX61DRAFT_507131, partial [Aspergillus egyptiacus]
MRCLLAAYHRDIRELDLISPENRDDIRRWLCSNAGPQEPAMTLPDILWTAVQTRADARAIEAPDGFWSYRELADACCSLARHLRGVGVESGDMVLLLREKSKWTVAGMMAILMSGAVCVPVDIRQPEDRVHRIAASTNARFILTSDTIARRQETWSTPLPVRKILVPVSPLRPGQSGSERVPDISPDATAFVFFTSGSTGIPKGVVQPHGAVAMTASQICRAMRMDATSRTFQYASYSFDLSIGDIFSTFWAGGCLCVPSEEQRLDALRQTINSMEATHMCTTPTVLAQLAPAEAPSLRQVTVGGESLTREQLHAWFPRIATVYGTTESVIWDTYRTDLTLDDSPANIGRAMWPTTTWVVDPSDATTPVPIGAVGELLIGGPLLSRGYLNDGDRTAASFLERPSWLLDFVTEDETGRLYRTGDLVRYKSDGSLQYLGRKDRQIKVNGQRVELGEIEYALRQTFPDGTACAAEMIQPNWRQGQEVLAAFIGVQECPLSASTWSLSSIRSKLTKMLPMYMVPSLFVPVQGGLPTTPTGKVDRTRLLRMGASLTSAECLQDLDNDGDETHRDPVTSNERGFQRLYAEALDIRDPSTVSMNTNFFQCGGTSLHAMKLVTLARNQGFSLSVIDVFEHPRLADLVTVVQRSTAATASGPETGEPVPPFSLLPSEVHLEDIRAMAASCCRTTPTQVRDVFPSTPLQEGLLALSSKNPGDYIYQAVIELPPTVDLDQFREAYESAADRMPILRCRAFALPQANHQTHMAVIDEPEEWHADSMLGHCSENDVQQLSSCRLGDRLVRCSLVVEPTQKRYFVWTIHHALFDGWSFSLMLDELENQVRGDAITSLLPFQNFVHYLQNAVDQKACKRFWASHLEGATRLQFPPSLRSVYQPSERIATVRRAVAEVTFLDTGVTPTTAIQGAWAVLLSQHAASSDVVFGATVIGRHAAVPGIERIAGPTIATVPFRVQLDFTQSVARYLQQLQLGAIRTVPYEQLGLSEIAKVSPHAEKACSFQTLLVVQPPPEVDTSNSGTHLFDRSQVNPLGTLRTYPVTLQCWLLDSGSAEFQMEIDEMVLDRSEGERLLAQLEAILRRLCAGPLKDAALATVLPCSEADMAQISRWNPPPTPMSGKEDVLQLISKQVAACPDRLAVDAWDGSLTYSQLDRHVSQVTGQLLRLNVEMQETQPAIVICMEKSHLAVVAFLAVLKAGGVCVLVDPSHPSQRLKSIIERSHASFAVTDEAESDRLSQWTRTITISELLAQSPVSAVTLEPRPRLPTHDACIVFTSGSTGEPKAICWSHETVAVTASTIGARFHLSSRSRVFQFSSYAFDVSIHETMATLVHGGCICVPSEQSRQDALQQSIVSFKASTIILTPSVAQVLDPQYMPCLETVVFCGEPLSTSVARTWSKSMAVYNWYGPAECSLATCCRVGDSWRAGNIGVGASTSTWIVHPQDHEILQPIGAVGELLLQGPCVASRYAQDEARTAQSFINPPRWWQQCHSAVTGTQMYKSGDLARYANDGSLILLGRKDMQVKIRGQRVELEEIQGRIQEILGADAAVVVDLVSTQDRPEAPTLTAFVQTTAQNDIPHNNHIASVDWAHTVQVRLSDTLPTWMVPAVFLIVRQFPQTSTGKVDRRELQALGASWLNRSVQAPNSVTSGGTWEPSSEAEAVLGGLWMEVLGLSPDQLTSNAHFIRLGGNSIDAMHLVAAAASKGYNLSVRDVLKSPRLAELSRQIRRVSPDASVAEQRTNAPFSLIRDTIDLARARNDAASQCRVRPDQVEDMFPCTALQTALLALTSKRPGDYVSQNIYHIQGDLGLFKSSWEAVVSSAPILRTRIVDLGEDNFFQTIIDEPVEWDDAYETLDDYLHHDQHLPMGLGTSLVRWGILPGKRDRPSSFTFIWTIHHSLYDGWSFQAILDRVERFYNKKSLAPTAPFTDFVKYTMDPKRELAAMNFWKQSLDGAVAPQFPVLPSSQYQPRACCTMEYRASLSPAAGRANHANHTSYTLTTILRAAWSLVLARYSRSTDVVFGATVLGRQAPVLGVTDMIGPTIATTPVRVRWVETDTVQHLLQTVHQDGLDMIPFEQLGLQKIRRLGPDADEACRFQTMLIVQPAKEQRQNGAGLFDKFQGDEGFGLFSSTALMLRCSLASTPNMKHNGITNVDFHLDFDPEVVEEQQARRILCQMDHTLSELSSASPSTQLGDLQLLNKSDLETILLWNKKTLEPVSATVLDLFRGVVEQFPTAPAVHAWDAELSYEELDRQATHVAHRLVSLGLQSLQRVPLYFEKSAWTVVAILGVLMVGGTAVLLEPSQPEERLRLIVDRINASLIVTSARNKDSARRLLPSSPVVVVDESIAKSTALGEVIPPPQIDSSSPVYIVFTSGTTGAPKGVVITHGNICSALKQRRSILPYRPGDRVLDGVSYAFDVCWGNILFTLCSGACLCVPATIDDVAVSINQFRVTVAGTVPSIARVLDARQYPTLKTLILGGEPAHLADLEDWTQRVDVFNSYGPAECTVSVCLARLNGEDRVHIGGGMGATLWIVDDNTNGTSLASIGSIGELWLEGPQVGLGYLEDTGSSAAAFIDGDPEWLSTLPASIRSKLPTKHKRRFYRTGDLAQYYPDGAVRLLGRRDTQVKLRGQRIELEEVEHHVRKHLPKGVELAAEVIVPRSSPSRQFLVMFVVPDPNRGLPDAAIRGLPQAIGAQLAQELPSYMRPSAYVALPGIPHLASGKFNRSKLREIGNTLTAEELSQPADRRSRTKRVTRPPRTSTEKKLCELWATTLGLEPSENDAEDSFLQLDGGDSISAMRLVRLAHENGMSLSAADVFSHPVLCDLVTVVTFGESSTQIIRPFSLWQGPWTVDRLREEAAARCDDVRPDQIEDIFPCTALQEGLLALTSRDPGLYTCREVFELHDHIDIPRMQQAWDTVVKSMPILRTRVIDLPSHGLHQTIVNEPIPWDSQDTPQPFKLGSRLAHWALVQKGQSKKLVWTIHHSLYDAWTVPRILKQVERAYYQEPLVPYLAMQPFIQYLSTVDEAVNREFWDDQLADSPSPSFPALPSASYDANAMESCSCFLPNFSWPVGVDITPGIWVRAAWALLVGHIDNTDDIVFGATVSGRQMPVARIQDIIGPTIATVPVRVRLNWGTSIGDFARGLQHQATEMIPFEQVGLHRLRQISEHCKQTCQFRTLINVQSAQTEPSTSRVWTRVDGEPNGQFDNFPLILDCELHKSGVFLRLDFDKKIVPPKQAERLVHQLETVLLQLSGKTLDLSKRLADFHPISHRDLLELWQWNAVAPEQVPVCLHQMIHAHVIQHPQTLAVDAWDGQITYGTLDQLSTNLASYLQNEMKAKVGPGIVIPLCFEKSKWTAVAALAVMKTGSAFTLMDTSHPEERLHTIVSQVNQRLVISSALNADLAARLAEHVVVVDHENASRWPPPRPLHTCARPDSELYVVFTSGSTGTPKGAVITHSNFASAVKHQGSFLGYNRQTRVYDFASYSFDIAVSNLLHSLAAGGCLCVP